MELKTIKKHVVTEEATRPAQEEKDSCFYCYQKIGDYHKDNCALVVKKVLSIFTINIPIEEVVPAYFDKENIEGKGTGVSSFCGSNYIEQIIEALKELESKDVCMCDNIKKQYIRTTEESYLDEE